MVVVNIEDLWKDQEKRDVILYKLAELGKIALTTQICEWGYDYADGDCHEGKCERNELCRAKAEILGGVSNG